MSGFRIPLHNFFAKIRYALARSRKRVLELIRLKEGHWKWASYGILVIMALFMAGMAIDFVGELHMGIFLAALLFFPGLALLAGLGVRLGLNLLTQLPERQGWIFFSAVFFVLFLFNLPEKAMLVVLLFILLSGTFLGAGIQNMLGGRWKELAVVNRVLSIVFSLIGAGLFIYGSYFLLYPGKAPDELRTWSLEATYLPEHLEVDDPSLPGPFEIDSLRYGWGKDKPRKFLGSEVELISKAVDGSGFLDGWDKLSGKLRSLYWKMGPDSLALNGRVWYPLGDGPFPLVLMVHGNHLDRDFSDPGYHYLGRHFASRGLIAVSVDENFLNGAWSNFSSGLERENDCRAWLLLKHLELWREWNDCDSIPFFGQVDLDRVVLIGHSRGGEAVSIASCFNGLPYYPDNAEEVFDFNFGIRGVAAIAPVDGQYSPAGIPTPLEDVNYFTVQGSMDADLRSYDGLRQMRRVRFNDSLYHFAAGLYLHGANHGQFNRSWGIFDAGYPHNLLLNRSAIIPAEEQEKVALVYLTAFVLESCAPGSGYLPLFRDFRFARKWLPGLVYLNQFHESTARILCNFEEDLDLSTGTTGVDSIGASGLALWKEGRIPKKWGDYGDNAVFLGWNNDDDSIPGWYTIYLAPFYAATLDSSLALTFLAADAQMDPGERYKVLGDGEESVELLEDPVEPEEKTQMNDADQEEENGNNEGAQTGEEDEEPLDFALVLTDTSGMEYRARLGDFHKLQPAIKPEVFKSRLFWEDDESEVVLQYVALPLDMILNPEGKGISAGAIASISFVFDAEQKGTILVDQLGFTCRTGPAITRH